MPTDITINPLDRSKKAIGIGLPMFTGIGSKMNQTYATLDQAEANARNLLLTNKGERLMQPNLGCDLYRTLFELMTEESYDILEDRIREQFDIWLPYIRILELSVFDEDDDPTAANKIYIKMRICLENNRFDTRSIELTISQNAV